MEQDDEVARGVLVVRASGAETAMAAMTGSAAPVPKSIQLLMRCPVHRSAPENLYAFGECALRVMQAGAVVLTVPETKLSTGFTELRPLMFQPVEVDSALRTVFANAVGHVIAARDTLDPVGVAHHLVGLAELVLRSALRAELNRVDVLTARRRDALEYIRAHLTEPSLTPDRVAGALFISRRRLYQLFGKDEPNVAERIKILRIELAKTMLADPAKTERQVGEIARDCGFVNAGHFSRAFHALVGQTPGQFRKRSR